MPYPAPNRSESPPMYTLHAAPDNASIIIELVLHAAGIPCQTALVDRAIRAQDSPAYLALNPAGLIPTLVTPQGPISETAAILLWLADQHRLGPAPADPARLPFLKWLFFLSNTAHADLRQIFYPHLYVPPSATPAHFALLTARMARHFALLDQAAARHPALFTTSGLLLPYTAALLRWSALYPSHAPRWLRLTDYPTLLPLLASLEDTPATRHVCASNGLGPTPFTAPHVPNPPEGSVL